MMVEDVSPCFVSGAHPTKESERTIDKMATMLALAWTMMTAMGCASGVQSTQRQLDHGQLVITGYTDSSAPVFVPKIGGLAQLGIGELGDIGAMASAHALFRTFEWGASARLYVGDHWNLSVQGTAAHVLVPRDASPTTPFSQGSVITRLTRAVSGEQGTYFGLEVRASRRRYAYHTGAGLLDLEEDLAGVIGRGWDESRTEHTIQGWMGVNLGLVGGYEFLMSDHMGLSIDCRLSPLSVSRHGDLGAFSFSFAGDLPHDREAALDALAMDSAHVSL